MNIEQMAREAGFSVVKTEWLFQMLERFAALVRAQALEEAAAVCDSVYPMAQGDYAVGYEDARGAIEYKICALKASPDA